MWDDFVRFYAIFFSYEVLETYALSNYPNLTHFLKSWDVYKKLKCIPLIGLDLPPPRPLPQNLLEG
jgi:hypothetical protein